MSPAWHQEGNHRPPACGSPWLMRVASLSPQVNDFLSGRSPLTLALRVGDHMMFVQLQLAAQQSTGQLQHRHLIASRGEAGASASPHCRTLHGASGSGFARIPVVPTCQQSPAPSPAPAAPPPPMYCNAPHAAPVTAGMFRSHGASTQTVNSSVVSSCSEVSLGVSRDAGTLSLGKGSEAVHFPARLWRCPAFPQFSHVWKWVVPSLVSRMSPGPREGLKDRV